MFKHVLEIENRKRISGNDLFILLEHISIYGSISRAASQAGVSYRYAWGLLQEAEKILQTILVEKQVGGYAGGGAFLTAEGNKLLQEYKEFKEQVDRQLALFTRKSGYPQQVTNRKDIAQDRAANNFLFLATSLEPVETGLLDELENAFYRQKKILVRHLATGSGRALIIAQKGRVDMVLTHAPGLESSFMAEGWGVYKAPVMSNDFVVVGPAADPVGIREKDGKAEVADVFRKIALSGAPFVTRGDHSGTHLRELEIWEKAGIDPQGSWYLFYPGVAGNLGALKFAREKKAYMLTDLASYTLYYSQGELDILLDSSNIAGEELANTFVIMLVNPAKVHFPRLEDSFIFARWLLKEEGRMIISEYGRDLYQKPLFTPLGQVGQVGSGLEL